MPASIDQTAAAAIAEQTGAKTDRAKTDRTEGAAREAARLRAFQDRAGTSGAYQDIPIEIVQVLNPFAARPSLDDSPVRNRATMLAAWLRQGGDRADLPPLPMGDLAPLAEAPEAEPAEAAPAREVSEADRLALRLQILGGEIAEQVYGPSRRWAVLDREGELLEAPEAAWVSELIEAGRLALDRYERGAAVWRLTEPGEERRAAYCRKGADGTEER